MAEPLIEPEPKRHLALDMSWVTAACGAVAFVFCLLSAVSLAWRLFMGSPVEVRASWQTVVVVLLGLGLMIEVRERTLRFALGLLVLVSGSRLILLALHASAQTQVLNGQIMRVVDFVAMAGLCVYIAYWFKLRIKWVWHL